MSEFDEDLVLLTSKTTSSNTGLDMVRARALKQTHVRLQRRTTELHRESLQGIKALKQHTQEKLPSAQQKPSQRGGFWSYLEQLLHAKKPKGPDALS